MMQGERGDLKKLKIEYSTLKEKDKNKEDLNMRENKRMDKGE